MDLLKPSRRGFLVGLGALAVAPAIIRSGIIMPIKPQLVGAPSIYITAEMIATAFAQELYRFGSRRVVLATYDQRHVSLVISTSDRTLPFAQFIERYIRPAACVMARFCPNIDGPFLELPKGVREAAMGVSGGFGVRYVQDHDIHTDQIISRFDVLSS